MCNQDKGEEYLRDKVGNLLEINLEVLDEFFIEDLIETLNEIVHVFNKEAIPFALDVCTRLTEAYQDIMTQLGTSDTELENSKMANTANGCINAIYRLITSIGTQGKPEDREVIMKIEENSHDILFHSLDLKYSDVHESVMTCIGAITFYCENVTPNLWQLFEKLVELVSHHLNPETTDYGYISPGILGILNLMQKDPDTFINIKMSTDITPYDAVVSIITSIIDLSHDGEEDPILNKTGTELVIGLLENLHGKIDDSIHHIIELLVQEIGDNTDTSAKKMVIQGLLMCFAYNSPLTFRFLEEKDWTQGVFQVIFELLPEIKYDFEIKRMTLGLLSVISCKETEIPQLVLEAMPNIFQQILLLCQKSIYSREQKARSPEEKEKEQYEKSYNILDDWSDEDEYDEDDDYNPDDSKTESEDLYKSFTESVDEIQEVKSVMHSLGSNIYDLYFGKVPRDDIASLENCFSSPLVTN